MAYWPIMLIYDGSCEKRVQLLNRLKFVTSMKSDHQVPTLPKTTSIQSHLIIYICISEEDIRRVVLLYST